MPGPDPGSLGVVDEGSVPALAAFEGADSAFTAGAPLDGLSKCWAVLDGSAGLGGFALAGDHDRAYTQVMQAWAKVLRLSLPNGFVDAALGPLASALPKSSAERSAALIA